MKKQNFLSLFLLIFCLLFPSPVKAQTITKTVIFFHSATCPKCVIAEKYLLAEANAGKISLLEFENSKFSNLRAKFDAAFNVPLSAQNSIPIVFVGQQYLSGNAIEQTLEPVLASLKEEVYAYPLTFLLTAETSPPSAAVQTKKLPLQESFSLIILSLILFLLPLLALKKRV